jgi:hypothetical protein
MPVVERIENVARAITPKPQSIFAELDLIS